MKIRKALLFALIFGSASSLSGCFFKNILTVDNSESIVTGPHIEVVSSLKINLHNTDNKVIFPKLVNSVTTNPTFIYTSSDESVATVSSDGKVTGHKVGQSTLTIKLSNNLDIQATCKVNVVDEEKDTYDYTIMYYISGSDLEYSTKEEYKNTHLFTEDIQEILSVTNLPDSVKIIIQTGGSKKWFMPANYLEGATAISSTNIQRWEVNNETNKLTLIETLPTNQLASETSFTEFLSWGLDDYYANQMGVVISGHGGGIAGCAYDDNYTYKVKGYVEEFQHTLDSKEIAKSAENALKNSQLDKFTWIGYDCCLMQCADIASLNCDYFQYMIGSQELEDGNGWDHDSYLSLLKTDTNVQPDVLLKKITDSFVDQNCAHGGCGSTNSKGVYYDFSTLSVLDLSKMDAFTNAFNSYVSKLGSSEGTYSKIKSAFKLSYNSFGDSCYGLCDFKTLLIQLDQKFTSFSTSEVQEALNNLIIYNKFCNQFSSSNICGINAFFPVNMSKKDQFQVGKEDYSNASTKLTNWQQICYQYGEYDF